MGRRRSRRGEMEGRMGGEVTEMRMIKEEED